MSFRLWTIFYVFALVAAAMATFGPWGILVAAAVLALWGWIFLSPKPQTIVSWVTLVIILLFIVALLLPAVQSASDCSRSGLCKSNLKQLAIGLDFYNDRHGALPPAYLSDARGKPLLSWRVALLPLIEEQSLYDQIDRTSAWNDPKNKAVITGANLYYMLCPSETTDATVDYFAVIDSRTAWPGPKGCRLADVGDGASNTILLIEAHGRPISWAEPRDLTFDEAIDLLSRPVPENDGHTIENGFFYKPDHGRFIVFADTRIAFLRKPLDRKVAAALLTINGHEQIDSQVVEGAIQPQLDYAKCYIFGVFVILSLLPAARLRKCGAIPPGDS
jgi:hypothetical protein